MGYVLRQGLMGPVVCADCHDGRRAQGSKVRWQEAYRVSLGGGLPGCWVECCVDLAKALAADGTVDQLTNEVGVAVVASILLDEVGQDPTDGDWLTMMVGDTQALQ